MRCLAKKGAPEGTWLRADIQTAGRGRQGRVWRSPAGNLHASTLVRLGERDPPAPTLALVAGVALHDAVSSLLRHPGERRDDDLQLKWPNDLLLGSAKLAGILLERSGDTVIIGFGVNLGNAPEDLDRAASHLDGRIGAAEFLPRLALAFASTLDDWRRHGLAPIVHAWLARAYPAGTTLETTAPDGTRVAGIFDGLEPSGALRLGLADGTAHVIHAGDVHLV